MYTREEIKEELKSARWEGYTIGFIIGAGVMFFILMGYGLYLELHGL